MILTRSGLCMQAVINRGFPRIRRMGGRSTAVPRTAVSRRISFGLT